MKRRLKPWTLRRRCPRRPLWFNDTAAFTWRSFCGWPVGVVQDTDDTLHILLCVREQLGLPPLDPLCLLKAPLHEPPAVRPSWNRYAQENLFCLS